MTDLRQVRWSGLGGQGVVLAGVLLGQAGVIDGKYVSGSNSYGAQARGSECRSEIIFSDGPIDFPHLVIADFLITMSQGTYGLYSKDVREASGLILYDSGLITPKEGLKVKQVGIPATEYAVKKLKNKQVANIILLGAFIEMTKIVSTKAIRKAIVLNVNEKFKNLNLKALQVGRDLSKMIHG